MATSNSSQKSVNLFYKVEELKKINKKSLFKDPNIWQKYYEFLEVCKKLVLIDLDYALEKKIEVDLWNFGFKEIITQLQSEGTSRSILGKASYLMSIIRVLVSSSLILNVNFITKLYHFHTKNYSK